MLMRSVRSAICTSGEPVSVSWRRYSLIVVEGSGIVRFVLFRHRAVGGLGDWSSRVRIAAAIAATAEPTIHPRTARTQPLSREARMSGGSIRRRPGGRIALVAVLVAAAAGRPPRPGAPPAAAARAPPPAAPAPPLRAGGEPARPPAPPPPRPPPPGPGAATRLHTR